MSTELRLVLLRHLSSWRYALRVVMGVVAVAFLCLACGFILSWDRVIGLWPWQGDYVQAPHGLSLMFMGSICAAIGAPTLWLALCDELAAAKAGAVNLLISFGATAIYLLQGYAASGDQRLLTSAVVLVGLWLNTLLLALLAGSLALRDTRPTPPIVRRAFLVFATILVTVGVLLVFQTPNILPWEASKEGLVVYGWVFLGAAAYFVIGAVDGRWQHARGQLIGFLAYDLVLIAPFIMHFRQVRAEAWLSLFVYTAVVIVSGALAIYFLFIDKATRFGSSTA